MKANSVQLKPQCTSEEKASFESASKETWKQILPFTVVFLAACTLFFAKLGSYPLFNPDEALYAEPAREMLELKEYVTTYLNYVVRFTKPPLAIWGQALSIMAFGCNEFAVRFLGASTGALLVAATYWFTHKFLGKRAALVSAATLATAPLFIGTARVSITDMPLTFFCAGSLLSFYVAAKEKRNAYLWLAYVLTGLAVMTKGPVGLVLPVGILCFYHLLRCDLKEALRFYKPIAGLAIVSLIALPWFALEIYITNGAYFHDFIMRENFQRFTSVIDSHRGAWWYHIAALMGGFFPWSVFLPQAIVSALCIPRIRQYWANSGPISIVHSLKTLSPREELGLFCLCWLLFTLAFFSVSVSKLIPYTLPAFPALAVLLALEFENIFAKSDSKRAAIPAFTLAIIFGVATIVLPMALKLLRDAPVTLVDLAESFASYELIFAGAAAALASRKFFRSAFMLFLVPTFVGFLFFGNRILTVLSQTWEEPLPAMAQYAAVSDLPIFVYDMRKPSIPFYTRRKVVQPGSPDELKVHLEKSVRGAYILTKSKQSQFFRELAGCKIQYAEGKFLLVRYAAPPSLK